jgi:hypothetical protein
LRGTSSTSAIVNQFEDLHDLHFKNTTHLSLKLFILWKMRIIWRKRKRFYESLSD